MKDYAEYQGYTDIRGSRDAIRKALEMNLIDDRRWMETIEDRNLTSRYCENKELTEVLDRIENVCYPMFLTYEERLSIRI